MSLESYPVVIPCDNSPDRFMRGESMMVAVRAGHLHVAGDRWPTDTTVCTSAMPVLYCRHDKSGFFAVASDPARATVYVSIEGGFAEVMAWGLTLPCAQQAIQEILAACPKSQRDAGDPWVSFWSYGMHGASAFRRRIAVPAWADIRQNYMDLTRGRLDHLMGWVPDSSGQLVLWHGEPGTGKTYALRALIHAWRNWCQADYITDPEGMFGEHADYLVRLLLEPNEAMAEAPQPERNTGTPKDPWRLVILEDTGELLRADAKERTGQALSRLLNTVDGLLGQGLRVMVMITTNEPVGRLHPAVTRYGRCFSQVEFTRFQTFEAQQWMACHHAEDPADLKEPTLAELYGAVAGRPIDPLLLIGQYV